MKNRMQIVLKVLFPFVLSQQAWAVTFEEAWKTASQNSSEIKELKLEVESATWNKIKANSGFLPKLELQGRHLFNEQFQELEVPFGNQTFVMPAIQPYSSLGLNASLNIFDGFRTINEVAAANLRIQFSQQRLERLELQKRVEISTLFYRALGSQMLVNVADQNIQTLESHLSDVNSRIRSGVSTKFDSLRAEVQLEDVRTEKIAAENAVVIARAKLFEAMNIDDDGKLLEGQLPQDFSRIEVEKLSVDLSQRKDRTALIAERDLAEELSQSSKSHWYPKISLFGNYEWYNNINHSVTEADNRFKSAYALGVLVSWNLFDGGSSYASQRQAALASAVVAEKLAKFDRGVPVALEETKRKFSYDVVNYKAKLSSVKKAEEAVRLAKGGLKAGIRTNTEVLDAVVDLHRAKAAAVNSQINAIEDLGKLELAVGHWL